MQYLIDELKKATSNFIEAFAIASVLLVLVFWFIGQPLEISGDSMEPNFHDGEHTIANKLSFINEDPRRSQVVITKHPEQENILIIKRIVAIPGDKFMISDGKIYLNGDKLQEDYLKEETITSGKNAIGDGEIVNLEEGEYIVLGDNRENSQDSRNWGVLNREDIIGLSTIVYYPLENFRIVRQH